MDNLLSCPFCGSKAEFEYSEQDDGIGRVQCTNIQCGVSIFDDRDTATATDKWNTRNQKEYIKFNPISTIPPKNDEEYFVSMYKEEVQDRAFTVALWLDGNWFPDAGDDSTITHWACLPDCLNT